ncbi:MAG: type IX secretion system sortase PorU [Bacteroidetes bacterium]|nr:type IX secretion system sortase PorU [Bacteroidota bacterium]
MKKSLRLSVLLLFCSLTARADTRDFLVQRQAILNGFYAQQVDVPADVPIHLVHVTYSQISTLPKGVTAANASGFSRKNGTERKHPFAIISIPAYTLLKDGHYGELQSFSLAYNLPPASSSSILPLAKKASITSPLASGTWYKLAAPTRGIYKIDFSLAQKLGLKQAGMAAQNIRIVGNGGAMLYESNAMPQPDNLEDNALWISDGGDGTFDPGDFIAFYAPGPMRWDPDSLNQRFIHQTNLYADSSYYFISFDAGPGLRIQDASPTTAPTEQVTSFNDYAAHEVDLFNPGRFGKEWWGELFGNGYNAQLSRTFNFPLYGNTDSVNVRISMAARASQAGTKMATSLNGNLIDLYTFGAVSLDPDSNPLSAHDLDMRLRIQASSANFQLDFSTVQIEDLAYLNYIELNWRRSLAFAGNNFCFRDWRSIAPSAVAAYTITNANAATQVWDISNPLQPQRMNGNLSNGSFQFNQNASSLHEFVALDGSSFLQPVPGQKVGNQDLHSADAPQMVIVTYPDFSEAAERLATFHRNHDGLRVLVATTTQVYNEFSSGAADIGGIRNMMRYFYREAGNDTSRLPKYLLLFGDASFDYKNRIPNNTNYVPTYESNESLQIDYCFTVDDYFGFLDDSEDISNFNVINTLDIGIGRLPVASEEAAEDAVNKIINYTSPASLGPWRISNTFIGDNEDGAGPHLQDAEAAAATVNAASPFSNDTKIYLDNLPFISTPAGERCPEANKAINDRIYKGTFLINYTGHGSTVTLAHERILTEQDFDTWKNFNQLPFMVTATCDYARYDDPAYVSDGEQLILKKDGGTISMLTTTGPVYAGINRYINLQFLSAQYTPQNGQWLAFGDAMREGKNETYKHGNNGSMTLINFYRFILLGDPALQPAFPKYTVSTDSILQMANGTPVDTLRALGAYTLKGHVQDAQGNLLPDFNGRAYITIFDKPRVVNLYTKVFHEQRSFEMQDNVIFKGITTVSQGHFSCSFVVPKDMNYDFGHGKISYYVENGVTDGAGYDTGRIVGGFFDGAAGDDDAPIVKPFIGDSLFRDGGITGPNTMLYVQLSDQSGINASGNSVGHDITAVLDGDEEHPFILNDYYETEPNTYQRGHVSFPISGLSDGAHTLRVKAWDVYNNSGEGTVHFVVGSSGFQILNLINYPNPFSNETHFFFEHNHPNETLKAQIAIYNMNGALVRLLEQSYTPAGSHSNELTWDGTDSHGAKLPSGVYTYRLMLSTQNGIQGTAYQKLVLLR